MVAVDDHGGQPASMTFLSRSDQENRERGRSVAEKVPPKVWCGATRSDISSDVHVIQPSDDASDVATSHLVRAVTYS